MVRMDDEDEDNDDDAKLWDSRVGLFGTLVARYIINIVSNLQCHCECLHQQYISKIVKIYDRIKKILLQSCEQNVQLLVI
jgi:hypothetical protein